MYNKILIPVDLGSPEKTKHSLEAAKQVGGEDPKLHLISVVEDIPAFVAAELPSGTIDNSRRILAEKLNELAATIDGNVETEVRSGTVYRAILSAAEEWDADIIVIGSHKPGAGDFLLGSTAAKVVRHAKTPVLVVR